MSEQNHTQPLTDSLHTCAGCAWLIDRDGNGHRPGSSCDPAVPCAKNHFNIETGAQCPRCGKIIQRDGLGREIDAPETEPTPAEVEARLASCDLIGSLVNIYHAIKGEDCPRHLALGMATAAVSSLKRKFDALENEWKVIDGIRVTTACSSHGGNTAVFYVDAECPLCNALDAEDESKKRIDALRPVAELVVKIYGSEDYPEGTIGHRWAQKARAALADPAIWHSLGRPCGATANEAEGITEIPEHVNCPVCLARLVESEGT